MIKRIRYGIVPVITVGLVFLAACASRQTGEDQQGLVAEPDTQELENFENFEDAFGQALEQSVVGEYIGKGRNANIVIYFDYNSAYIALDGRKAIDGQIEVIKRRLQDKEKGGFIIRVEGHTDERGTDSYNLALGQRRANTVARYISIQGVPSTNIRVISYGETQPKSSGSGEITWAENRRVEIKFSE